MKERGRTDPKRVSNSLPEEQPNGAQVERPFPKRLVIDLILERGAPSNPDAADWGLRLRVDRGRVPGVRDVDDLRGLRARRQDGQEPSRDREFATGEFLGGELVLARVDAAPEVQQVQVPAFGQGPHAESPDAPIDPEVEQGDVASGAGGGRMESEVHPGSDPDLVLDFDGRAIASAGKYLNSKVARPSGRSVGKCLDQSFVGHGPRSCQSGVLFGGSCLFERRFGRGS